MFYEESLTVMDMGRRRNRKSWLPPSLDVLANPLILLVLIYAWIKRPATEVFLTISAAALVYFLFFALRVCNMQNKDGSLCGNNAHGLLRGCRRWRRHQIQARWRFVPPEWRPVSVRRHFETAAAQRRGVDHVSATSNAAAFAAPAAESVGTELGNGIIFLELFFAGGSFFVELIALLRG